MAGTCMGCGEGKAGGRGVGGGGARGGGGGGGRGGGGVGGGRLPSFFSENETKNGQLHE